MEHPLQHSFVEPIDPAYLHASLLQLRSPGKSLDYLNLPADWFLYWLHAIQACMTLAWFVTTLFALNTYRKVLRAAKNFSDDNLFEGKHTHLVCLSVHKEPIDVLIETIDSIARCVRNKQKCKVEIFI